MISHFRKTSSSKLVIFALNWLLILINSKNKRKPFLFPASSIMGSKQTSTKQHTIYTVSSTKTQIWRKREMLVLLKLKVYIMYQKRKIRNSNFSRPRFQKRKLRLKAISNVINSLPINSIIDITKWISCNHKFTL